MRRAVGTDYFLTETNFYYSKDLSSFWLCFNQ
ncbi:hypothetical protein [Escherichia phage UPWr_E1]